MSDEPVTLQMLIDIHLAWHENPMYCPSDDDPCPLAPRVDPPYFAGGEPMSASSSGIHKDEALREQNRAAIAARKASHARRHTLLGDSGVTMTGTSRPDAPYVAIVLGLVIWAIALVGWAP